MSNYNICPKCGSKLVLGVNNDGDGGIVYECELCNPPTGYEMSEEEFGECLEEYDEEDLEFIDDYEEDEDTDYQDELLHRLYDK